MHLNINPFSFCLDCASILLVFKLVLEVRGGGGGGGRVAFEWGWGRGVRDLKGIVSVSCCCLFVLYAIVECMVCVLLYRKINCLLTTSKGQCKACRIQPNNCPWLLASRCIFAKNLLMKKSTDP